MLGVIHRAVLGEGPSQLRSFFLIDNADLRRSARHSRNSLQLACNFGNRPLDTLQTSVLGLCRVYNLLPAQIVACKTVKGFQGALQQLLCSHAVLERPNWQDLLSQRWPIQQHPLRVV